MKNKRSVTININDELLQKLEYVAKQEGRSLNNHFMLMARKNIDYYEKTFHTIKINENIERNINDNE